MYLSASRETQLILRERVLKSYMQEQINAGFPDFFAGVETGLLLLTLRGPNLNVGKQFGLKLDLQLFAKADIKMIEQIAKKWKMSAWIVNNKLDNFFKGFVSILNRCHIV